MSHRRPKDCSKMLSMSVKFKRLENLNPGFLSALKITFFGQLVSIRILHFRRLMGLQCSVPRPRRNCRIANSCQPLRRH